MLHDDNAIPPLRLRPKHRRVRSATAAFTTERSQGAFVPLPSIPRRRPSTPTTTTPVDRKPMFHFKDENDDSDSSDDSPPSSNSAGASSSSSQSYPSMNALGLTVDTRNVPPNAPNQLSDDINDSNARLQIPFPTRGSPSVSPQPPSPSPPSNASSLPRTPSTPIILSNGKPLKPSLKSSQSSPHIPNLRIHTRAQSEPSTPGTKNVHFAEENALQSVRLFNSSGKPVNVSLQGEPADETETETEYDSSSNSAPSYFPPVPSSNSQPEFIFTVDTNSSPIPNPAASPSANVHLETLVLPPQRPPVLRGSVLVRNLAYTKEVAVRFTLDNWNTTSEVICKHVVSLPSLPPPFPSQQHRSTVPATPSFQASGRVSPPKLEQAYDWDRFSFSIRLEDFERKLSEKTLFLVVRYTVPSAGEWWDNNGGKNYGISFRRLPIAPAKGKKEEDANVSPVMGNSQQRTFSAPSTLKGTPTTEAVLAHANPPTSSLPRLTIPPPVPGPLVGARRHHASVPRPPAVQRSISFPATGPAATGERISSTENVNARPSSMYASLPTKLNLLNYSAPSPSTHSSRSAPVPFQNPMSPTHMSPPTSPLSSSSVAGGMMGLSSMSLGSAGVGLSSSRPSSIGMAMDYGMNMGMMGGMPASGVAAPKYDFNWPPTRSSSSSASPSPSPPPEYSYLPQEHQRTPSPPPLLPASLANSKSSASAPSTTTTTASGNKSSAKENGGGSGGAGLSADTYAALVKQWCYVQSPGPSPPTALGPMSAAGGGRGALYTGTTGMRSDSPMLAGM